MEANMSTTVYRLTANGMKPIVDPIVSIGQIVWLNGYGQNPKYHDRKVVYMVEDCNWGKKYHTVNIDKSTLELHQHIRPESELFGIGTYYTPGDMFTGDIEAEVLKATVNMVRIKNEEANEATLEKAARIVAIETLNDKYKHLEKMEGCKKSRHALGGSNVKRELKTAFPSTSFRITSRHGAIDIHWTDGPTTEMIKKISDKYQRSDFNGMEDIEECRNSLFPELFGGATYVFEQRTVTKERYIETAKEYGLNISIDDQWNWIGCDWEEKQRIERETWTKGF
jgi:hypothetical protein